MNAGDTFLIPMPGTSLDSHLWIVISDPAQDAENVVIVNFTSFRADKDLACVVEPEEHRYLSKRSCIAYGQSKLTTMAKLQKLINTMQLNSHDPLSPELLDRIRKSVADSRMKLGKSQVMVDQGLTEL